MSRLEDIRAELTEAERLGNPEVTFYGYVTYSDVRFLLERIEHLQRENERLRELLREARPHIGDEYQRRWPDDLDFDEMLGRVDAEIADSSEARLDD